MLVSTWRCRERLRRGACVLPVEADATTFDLMGRFGGLKDSKTGDREAVATALRKLLRRALEALLRGKRVLPCVSHHLMRAAVSSATAAVMSPH